METPETIRHSPLDIPHHCTIRQAGERPRGARRLVAVSLLCLFLFLICTSAACKSSYSESAKASRKKNSGQVEGAGTDTSSQVKVLARLEDASINESSGIVASRRNPELFWTHNDSGDAPFIFAFDRQGKRRGTWRVEGAKARDWEDIAIGPGPLSGRPYLYVGDIGDNQSVRDAVVVYRFPEPAIDGGDASSSRTNPRHTETADVIRLRYQDGAHDAEALMVHPLTGDIYIATKTTAASTVIYKLTSPASATDVNTLARIGEVRVPSAFGAMITGGDISPDGRRVVLCDYLGAYELRLNADSASAFDTIWKQPAVQISLGVRQQGESVCYRLDGAALLATSEGRNPPLIEVELRENAREGG